MLHQRRLSSPPASALPERYAEALTTSSSAPSRAGAWDSHQRTSRMSRLGSASGSQPGQYARATLAAPGRKSVHAALLMSLHLLPLRCRARSGGFAVGRIRVGVLRATRRYSETTPGPATEVKAGHAIAEPTGEVIRAVNRGDVPTKLVILYVAPPRTPFLEEEEGREPAPCSQASFAALMQAWADSGAACPAR